MKEKLDEIAEFTEVWGHGPAHAPAHLFHRCRVRWHWVWSLQSSRKFCVSTRASVLVVDAAFMNRHGTKLSDLASGSLPANFCLSLQ